MWLQELFCCALFLWAICCIGWGIENLYSTAIDKYIALKYSRFYELITGICERFN
jgi:hypothetical protein